MKAAIENKRAYFDYHILKTFEAGLELFGFEVKAVKGGRANLAGSYVVIINGEAFLINADIPPYQPKNAPADYDPKRSRRLLLRREEIRELIGSRTGERLTIVPLKLYSKKAFIKLLIGLARHKKAADKRETIKKREARKEMKGF
ncbi:MAG: SsrA-binding protein SmpB [Parcubacteria group bacterium]|nr:SsrA-binding protein SmpB [Parcubacteria group bacterium]